MIYDDYKLFAAFVFLFLPPPSGMCAAVALSICKLHSQTTFNCLLISSGESLVMVGDPVLLFDKCKCNALFLGCCWRVRGGPWWP